MLHDVHGRTVGWQWVLLSLKAAEGRFCLFTANNQGLPPNSRVCQVFANTPNPVILNQSQAGRYTIGIQTHSSTFCNGPGRNRTCCVSIVPDLQSGAAPPTPPLVQPIVFYSATAAAC